MLLCLLFLLYLGLAEQVPLKTPGAAKDDKPDPRVLGFSSEEIIPGVLAIPADLKLPDCADPKYQEFCKSQTNCQGSECILASMIEKNNDIGVEKNEENPSFTMSDFFDLIYDTMDEVNRTRRDTFGEFDEQ